MYRCTRLWLTDQYTCVYLDSVDVSVHIIPRNNCNNEYFVNKYIFLNNSLFNLLIFFVIFQCYDLSMITHVKFFGIYLYRYLIFIKFSLIVSVIIYRYLIFIFFRYLSMSLIINI